MRRLTCECLVITIPGYLEWSFCPICGIKTAEEKKGPRRVAPALIKNSGGRWVLTKALYDSQEDAGHELMGTDTPPLAVVWPAIPNKDGYFEIVNP